MKNLAIQSGIGIYKKEVELKDVILVQRKDGKLQPDKLPLDEFLIKLVERIDKLEERPLASGGEFK